MASRIDRAMSGESLGKNNKGRGDGTERSKKARGWNVRFLKESKVEGNRGEASELERFRVGGGSVEEHRGATGKNELNRQCTLLG